jgi:hypothetical protein
LSLATLLDTFTEAGQVLDSSVGERRERAEQLVFPVWEWLSGIQALARSAAIDWGTVDQSLTPDDERQIAATLSVVIAGLDAVVQHEFDSALAEASAAILRGLDNAQANLRAAGIDARSLAEVFWPLRSQLAIWSQREEAGAVLDRTRNALTEVGAKGLALNFDDQFSRDLAQANRFRGAAMLSFVLALAWSIYAVFTLPHSISAADIAGRGAVSLSLAIMGGFLVRESAQHRIDANVWRTVQLQLNAIEAYSAALPRETAESIRLSLGLAVFSGPRLYSVAAGREPADVQAVGLSSVDATTNTGRDLLAALRELVELVKEARNA